MGSIRTRGIVIRTTDTGEADRYITLFTEDHGKISVFAKGVKRSRSRYAGSTQLLCFSDFILFHYKDRYTLNSAETTESFYALRQNIVKLTYAAHFLDLINDVVQENLPMPRLLKLLLNSLHLLTRPERDPAAVCTVFELKTLCILGYTPQMDKCVYCGASEPAGASFSFSECGCVCDSHGCIKQDPYAYRMSKDTYDALRGIVNSNMAECFKYGFSKNVLDELKWISAQYMRERLDRAYTKLDYLHLVEGPGL